jgi:kynurenine formamidase
MEMTNEKYGGWIDEVAARRQFGRGDRKGTANFIDNAARSRAAASIQSGTCTALNRPLAAGPLDDTDQTSMSSIRLSVHHNEMAMPGSPPMQLGAGDTVQIEAHGTSFTHLDALNHMGRSGTWYGGFNANDPNGPSIVDLANHLLFTRAILVDIPSVRSTEWVDPTQPATGDDIDAAIARSGAEFAPGDALLLYMGRDRYEDAGNSYNVEIMSGDQPMPGAGAGVARWIVEHDVSMLAWDFLDAWPRNDTEPSFQVHSLLWAIGLLLLDNCHLGSAAAAVRESGRCDGALVVTTPPIPGLTGALVQPLFIQ